jgi:protein-tyrosine phosphatase
MAIIDFHNHLMPGVDDGARDPEGTRAGMRAFRTAGVAGAIATPHFAGSLTLDAAQFAARMAELDAGWRALRECAAAEEFRVWRGAEVALDIPSPELGDERLRLAGTRFVLIEFAFMAVPVNSADILAGIRERGWVPVLAHPERYLRMLHLRELPARWRAAGALLQVNGASLLGRYGPEARQVARRLLAAGEADYVCSDYHVRGEPRTAEYRAAIARHGPEQAELLLEVNPGRLLQEQLPLPDPPLPQHSAAWRRFREWFR